MRNMQPKPMKENIICVTTDDVSPFRLLILITAHFAFCIKFIYKVTLICFYCSTKRSETPVNALLNAGCVDLSALRSMVTKNLVL
jgi:hypothetical protein